MLLLLWWMLLARSKSCAARIAALERQQRGGVDKVTSDGVHVGIVLNKDDRARQVVVKVVAKRPDRVRLSGANVGPFDAVRLACGDILSKGPHGGGCGAV